MKILIQCGDHLENQNRIMTLASELKIAGHTPIILLYSKHKGRYFENQDIQTVSFEENTPLDLPKANITIDSSLESGIKYNDILNAEAKRRPMISWPGQRVKTIRDIYKTHSAINKIIESLKPEKIIIWNGFTGYVANTLRLICATRNIECAFLERGLLKGSLFIDRQGVNGASSLNALTPAFLDELTVQKEDIAYVSDLFSVDLQPKINSSFGATHNVFFPLQVQLDTNIILYCKYRSMREAFLDIHATLSKKESSFLIRPHPEETQDTPTNIPRFSNTKVTASESLDHWIDWSDIVVTINSTVGLEALIKGKQVITLGESIYSSAGLTSSLSAPLIPIDAKHNNRLINYLIFLTKSNILISNSPHNKSVIASQLLIENSDTKEPVHTDIKAAAEVAEIHIDFPLNSTLDLTYRKNKAPITKDWLTNIVKNHVNAVTYEFSNSSKPRKNRFTVKIVSESKTSKRDYKFNKTIDIYGNEVR